MRVQGCIVVVVSLLATSSLRTSYQWMKENYSPTISTVRTHSSSPTEDKRDVHAAFQHWDVCLEGANKKLQNWTDFWFSQKYPIFVAATAAPPQSGYSATTFRNQTWMYHLAITTGRGVGRMPELKSLGRVFQGRLRPQWYCVDKNESRLPAEVLQPFPKYGQMLTLTCPTSMELHQIQADLHPHWRKFSYPPVISYHVQPHVDCARQRMATLRTSRKTTHTAPNIVACTLIKGGVSRKILHEWIEYHRMIGIEYFMVYLHEPYQSSLPNLTYVEYIPFDVEGEYIQAAKFLFQMAQQNDCLTRSRALGSKWVVTHDVDEYIHVVAPPPNSTADMKNNTTLLSILEEAAAENPGMGAFHLSEAHFGRQTLEERAFVNSTAGLEGDNYTSSPPALVMDYVFHGPLLEGGGKVIMRPENVIYTTVHEVVSGGPNERMDPSVVRLNHYYRPHLHLKERRYLDTSLRDAYRDRLFDRLTNQRSSTEGR